MKGRKIKNKKGEIATLLTLGLVIVGGVLTIITSVFTNRQKNLASNPRALQPCEINQRNCVSICGSFSKCSSWCSKQYNVPEEGTADRICIEPNSIPGPTNTSTPAPGCSIGDNRCGSGYRYECKPGKSPVDWEGTTFDGNGCDPSVCPTKELPFACYVVDGYNCDSESVRYRWYGCTGQPCMNTKIKQPKDKGPGVLVGKPIGTPLKNPKTPEECISKATPTPTRIPKPTQPLKAGDQCDRDDQCSEGLVCRRPTNSKEKNIKICVTPPSTQPPPGNEPTPKPGEAGGECLFKSKTGDIPGHYYCLNNLICDQNEKICVTPTPAQPSSQNNPTSTELKITVTLYPTIDYPHLCQERYLIKNNSTYNLQVIYYLAPCNNNPQSNTIYISPSEEKTILCRDTTDIIIYNYNDNQIISSLRCEKNKPELIEINQSNKSNN